MTLLLLKLTARVVPVMETALLRLRSMPMPVRPLSITAKVTLAMGVPAAVLLASVQTVFGAQPDKVEAVSFKKVISAGLENASVALLYEAAGIFRKVPRKAVSD